MSAPSPGTVVTSAVERVAVEAANASTMRLYYVREHVRQSLPAVLQSRGQLQQTAAEAADATYAANHSREFGRTMRTALPASLHRLEGCLRDASWTASEISRQQKEVRGGASSSSSPWGGWVPARLRGLWLGNSSGQSGSNAMYDHF